MSTTGLRLRWAPLLLLASLALPVEGAGRASVLAPGPATTPGFARVEGRKILDADGKPILLRGINLGNWLVAEGYMFRLEHGPQSPRQIEELVRDLVGPQEAAVFWGEYRDTWITRDDIQYLKRIGLNSIRVPFNYRVLTPEDRPGVWLEDGFALLDRVIRWSREAGLLVVLDMHCAPGGQTGANIDDSHGYPWLFEEESAQARTTEVWRKLAERYRDEPALLGYDLLNEPIPHWEGLDRYNPQLEPLYRRIAAAVREVDPHHVLFLGGARWDTNFSVFGPPFDSNLVYTFHKYWNETDDASLHPYLEFRDRHDVPLWLGEAGENTDDWIAACVKLVEEHGIGWAFWPYKKMDATSSILSIDRPPHWDEIVSYAARRTYDFEANYKIRPPLEHSRAALRGLIENARFANGRVNRGYVRALGLDSGAPAGAGSAALLLPDIARRSARAGPGRDLRHRETERRLPVCRRQRGAGRHLPGLPSASRADAARLRSDSRVCGTRGISPAVPGTAIPGSRVGTRTARKPLRTPQ
jgi:aryl-phospho-beta-D-glucosidase BglC (GH1 family)